MPDLIDLRSDTVTRPTPGMRTAMASAEVGDDVFGDDPTVIRLQERVAELLGKEAALYVPSGTMSNQLGLRAQTQPGDEVICDLNCHIYNYEAGGPAILSGLTCRTVEGERGILDLKQLVNLIRPDNEHLVRTRMVCLENTHNRGGGSIYPLEKIAAISAWAHEHGLIMHLDGARLMNAVVATSIPARTWASHFDSVSICFSKGLGAPIGSALAGTKDMIASARRSRKLLGGGMRQVGVIAAAALYALEHHVERLRDDHANAQILAEAIEDSPGLQLWPEKIETNIVYMKVDPNLGGADAMTQALQTNGVHVDHEPTVARMVSRCLREHGVLASATAPETIRMVTHLDASRSQVERAAEMIRKVARKLAGTAAAVVQTSMHIHHLHSWDLTPKDAIALQKELACRVEARTPLTRCELIAGADVSYQRFGTTFYGGVVVLRADDLAVVEKQSVVMECKFPYVPGLLSFREAPVLLEAFARIQSDPDVIMLDGQGIAHPRRFGLACHLGLWLDRPTLGCAKTLFVGKHGKLRQAPGAVAVLRDKEETVGMAVRTRLHAKPVFVSVGHRLDLASAVRAMLASCRGYRLPEPTRQAHLLVNAVRSSAACSVVGHVL